MYSENQKCWTDQFVSKLQVWDLFKYLQENVGGINLSAELFFEKELDEMQELPIRLEQHGTWFHTDDGYPYCSVCGRFQISGERAEDQDYCDYCGARMDGKEEIWPELKSRWLGGNSK